MMEDNSTPRWDEARYLELNSYFRGLINKQLSSNPNLKQQQNEASGLQLKELVESLDLHDQHLWQEFMALDQHRMHQDMQNFLEGKSTSAEFQNNFFRTHRRKGGEDQPW